MRCRPWSWLVVLGVLARLASATPALDKPAFTATPAELLAAAKAAPKGDGDVVILREDDDVSYDERGRVTARRRLVIVVVSPDAAEDWGTVSSSWLPSQQDKPVVRARVIDASGRVADLDPKQVTDAPMAEAGRAGPSDRRRLEAMLPLLSAGSVIEQEVTTVDREPLVAGGAAYTVDLGVWAATASARIRFSAPTSSKLRVVARGITGTKPKVETIGGRQITTYTLGPVAPAANFEWFLPLDVQPHRYVRAAPARSWATIARDYRTIVDKQIAAGPITLPAELPKTASLDTVRAIVAWRHKHVPYSNVGVDEAWLVPSPPAEVVKRGHANAVDAATLVVALLRQAGIPAELALIDRERWPGLDVDLPALDQFDHVLVRVRVGKTEVWLDPVAELEAPGRLPSAAQGRHALVIADATTALITTPVAPATESLVREIRTFELADTGTAKVTEVSREGGAFEAAQRAWVHGAAPEALRRRFASHVERRYDATLVSYSTTPADDLTKPFEVTVVASNSRRAYTGREDIEIYLWPTEALENLPYPLGNPTDGMPARTHDFMLPTPHIYEIENRLVVPAGFTMPAPGPDRIRELGPFKLVEKRRVDGQAFVVTFRLEATKARLKAAEVTAVQDAVRALRREDAVRVVIPQTAIALAAKGKYRDALAEVNRLIKLDPKKAIHHQQLAQVLIKAGAGAAARRAMRKVIELEPSNADAYVMLAWVLRHDSFGIWHGFDHDHAGAVAALQKARKLDPKHVGAATDLAGLLEHDTKGRRFESGADLRGAVEAWRAARALEDTSEITYSLALALAWSGNAVEAEKVLRSIPSEERRDQLLIAVIAQSAGPEAAIRFADTLGASVKAKHLGAAGGALMLMRRYDAMRALFAEANLMQVGSPQARVAQKLARVDTPFKPLNDPKDVAFAMLIGDVRDDRSANVYWDKLTRDELQQHSRQEMGAMKRADLMTEPLLEDIVRSTTTRTVEGDSGLWRVEHESFGYKSQVYLAADRGTPKVIAVSDLPRGAGRHVLRLLAKNDEKGAQRLLDWVARDLGARTKKDQLSHELNALWGANLPRTRAAIEMAAAVLAGKTDAARVVPILTRCKPTTSDGQLACDWELADLYRDTARWSELVDHTREWLTRAPKQLDVPTLMHGMALARVGKFDDAERAMSEALAKEPDNRSFAFAHADVAIARGRLAEAVRRLEPLTKKSSPDPGDLNNVAWLMLAEGNDLKGAAALAEQAVQQSPNAPHSLNTLAAIEAELGDLGGARQHMLKSIEANNEPRPGDSDTYVHGRILEQLGFTDDAVAIYRKLKPRDAATFAPLAADLAARRLKALGVKN